MTRLILLSTLVLSLAAIPAVASPIYTAGTYAVSGTFDNQSLSGTIQWNGNKVTGYSVNFDGQTFTCSSNSGLCGLFAQTIKIPGGSELLAGLFAPGNSPFALTVNEKGVDPLYICKVSWSRVAAPEESSLVQAGCLLALLGLAIPWASRLRAQKA